MDRNLRILLCENRALEKISRGLNLEYYLGAEVEALENFSLDNLPLETPPDIIIARSKIDDVSAADLYAKVLEKLAGKKAPYFLITGPSIENFSPDTLLEEPCNIKSILAVCAKQFGITAKMMAEKEVAAYLPLPKGFHRALLFLPCDLYTPNSENVFNKEMKKGEFIEKALSARIEKIGILYVKAMARLQFVNSLTEQKSALESALGDKTLEKTQSMSILSASTDMIAERVRSAGLDAEAVSLATTTITNIDTLVQSYPEIQDLLKDIVKAKVSFRFLHAQLVTFVGFHVLKILGDWNDVFRTWWSEIAFFQNMFLETEEEYRVYNKAALEGFPFDRKPVVGDHAQICSQVLEGMEQLTNEVVVAIRGHHGNLQGKGFPEKLEAISPLATMAFFTDRCASYLADRANGTLSQSGREFWQEMEAKAESNEAKEILAALQYLDPDHFLTDFLLPETDPLAPSMEELSKAFSMIPNLPKEVKQKWQKQLKTLEAAVIAESESSEVLDSTVIHNATMIIKDELIQVSDHNGEYLEPEQVSVIKNTTMVIKDELIAVSDHNGEYIEPEQVSVIKGSTMNFRDELITIKNYVEDNSSMDAESLIKGTTEHIDTLEKVVVGKVGFRKSAPKLIAETTTISAEEKADAESAGIKKLKKVTPLMTACLQGDLAKITALAADRAALTETDEEGKIALHYAALSGKVDVIQFFLNKGMNVNTIDVKRRPPLFFAIVNKQNEAFDFLLSAGARTQQQLLGSVSLAMVAAGSGNGHAFNVLLNAQGFRFDAKDFKGKNIVDYARIGKSREVLTLLAEYRKESVGSA